MARENKDSIETLNKLRNNPEYIRHGADAVGVGGTSAELEAYRREQALYRQAKRTKRKAGRYFLILLFLALLAYGFYWTFQEFLSPVDENLLIDRNSPHYVNDLYASDGRHYEKLLSDDQKLLYMDWLNALKNQVDRFNVKYDYFKGKDLGVIRLDVEFIYRVLMMDHPELFFLGGYALEGNDVYRLMINNHYISESKFILDLYERRIQRKLDNLYNRWKNLDSDFAKEAAVYEWIAKNNANGASDSRIYSSAASALLPGKSIHVGGALASQLIFQRLGIRSDLVYGYLEFPRVFNLVYLEDGTYIYDVGLGIETINKGNPERLLTGLNARQTYQYAVYYIEPIKEQLGKKYLSEYYRGK